MQFRQPRTSDADDLLHYFNTLVQQDPERVERPEDVRSINHEKEVLWIESLLEKEKQQNAVTLCILKEEAIIGLGEIERRPRWIERHVAEIRFGLLPDHLDEGIELVKRLEERARAIGIELLYYFHLATQRQGIDIVRACGFELAGTLGSYYKKADGYVDRVFYSKKII